MLPMHRNARFVEFKLLDVRDGGGWWWGDWGRGVGDGERGGGGEGIWFFHPWHPLTFCSCVREK